MSLRGAIKLDDSANEGGLEALDQAQMILWGSYCGVHTIFSPAQVEWWRSRGWRVLVHPESKLEVVQAADGSGSTNYLWNEVMEAPAGSKLAIGTEGNFVRNARQQAELRGVEVMHLADIPDPSFQSAGCGCATMSRNDPPHLAGMLDLLRKGTPPDINRVLAGDAVDETTGVRDRPAKAEQRELVRDARLALETHDRNHGAIPEKVSKPARRPSLPFKLAFVLLVPVAGWIGSSAGVGWKLTRRARPPFEESLPAGLQRTRKVTIVTSDGERLGAWFVEGEPDQPCFLLLHGNGGARRNWAALLSSFEQRGFQRACTEPAQPRRLHG